MSRPSVLWQIQLPYATFGIVVQDGLVAEAAPIGKWMVGKALAQINSWVLRKGGKLVLVDIQRDY